VVKEALALCLIVGDFVMSRKRTVLSAVDLHHNCRSDNLSKHQPAPAHSQRWHCFLVPMAEGDTLIANRVVVALVRIVCFSNDPVQSSPFCKSTMNNNYMVSFSPFAYRVVVAMSRRVLFHE
jgi:hypothetical protein